MSRKQPDIQMSRRRQIMNEVNGPEVLDDTPHEDFDPNAPILDSAALRRISAMAEAESGEGLAGDIEAELLEILEDDEAREESVPLSGFETDIISKEMLEAQAQAQAEEAEQERIAKIVAEHDARLAAEEQALPGNEDERQSE